MINKEIKGKELYVYHNGQMVYKRWLGKDGKKRQPSLLWNINGWPHVWVG